MGNYRKNAKSIRIEKVFQNKYGNTKILENGDDFYESSLELQPETGVVISKTVTNGPCNRSGYLVLDTIVKNNLDTKFTFLHIPSKYNFDQAKIILEHWVTDLL